jgi:hypothetical protein
MTNALSVDFSASRLPWLMEASLRGVYPRRLEALAARALCRPVPRFAEHFAATPLLEHAHAGLRERGRVREIPRTDSRAIYGLANGQWRLAEPARSGDL